MVIFLIKTSIKVRVLNNIELGEKKNFNLQRIIVKQPILDEMDEDDLVNFGLKENVDMIA